MLELEFGMQLRPEVSGADEGEEDEHVLERRPAEGPLQGFETSRCLRRLEEDVRGTSKDGHFGRGVGIREGRGRGGERLQKCDVRFEVVAAWQGAADQPKRLFN